MSDPMGDCPPHGATTGTEVIDALRYHPSTFILFASADAHTAGMAVCFMNYSTFQAAPFVNIHDLAVLPAFRGYGVATALLHGVTLHAIKKGCTKVTLEVREDNIVARRLYAKMKFHSCTPPMEYLTRFL